MISTKKIGKDLLKKLKLRDKRRRNALKKYLKNKKTSLTGKDYYMVAMIFHHGTTLADYKKAIALAKKGMALGNKRAKWLYAAAIDRLLIKQGKKQKYGTQYQIKNGKWILYPVDPKVTDRERAQYGVIPLKEARTNVKAWNKKLSVHS